MNPNSWDGQVGTILGGGLYHTNFAFDIEKDPAKFDEMILKIVEYTSWLRFFFHWDFKKKSHFFFVLYVRYGVSILKK